MTAVAHAIYRPDPSFDSTPTYGAQINGRH